MQLKAKLSMKFRHSSVTKVSQDYCKTTRPRLVSRYHKNMTLKRELVLVSYFKNHWSPFSVKYHYSLVIRDQYRSLFSVKSRYVDTETSLALVSSLVIGDFWNVYARRHDVRGKSYNLVIPVKKSDIKKYANIACQTTWDLFTYQSIPI